MTLRRGRQGKRTDRAGASIPLPNLDTTTSALPLAFQGSSDVDYDPHAFYTRATNAHDHSSEIRTRVHSDLIGLVDRIVASGKLAHTPIKTRGDFLRDAMVHRVWTVAEMLEDPLFIALGEQQVARAKFQDIIDDVRQNGEIVTEIREGLTRAKELEDEMAVRMSVINAEQTMTMLREPYYSLVAEEAIAAREWLKKYDEDD